jgi:hypothetical protein
VTDVYEVIKQDLPKKLPSLFAPNEEDRKEAERIIYKRLGETGGIRQIEETSTPETPKQDK